MDERDLPIKKKKQIEKDEQDDVWYQVKKKS